MFTRLPGSSQIFATLFLAMLVMACTQPVPQAQTASPDCGAHLTPFQINDTTTVCILDSAGAGTPTVFTVDQCPQALGTITSDNTCSFKGGFEGMKQYANAGSTYFAQIPYSSGACNLDVTADYLQNLLGAETCQSNATDGCSGFAAVNPMLWGYTVLAPEAVGLGVQSIQVTDGGSGYDAAPSVRLTGLTPAGQGAQATATVEGGKVTAIQVTQPGQNYTLPPVVQILPTSGGSGATAVAKTKHLGGWGCTDSRPPAGSSINPYQPSGVAYRLTGPTGNQAVVAVVDRCGGSVQMAGTADEPKLVDIAPDLCAGYESQMKNGPCSFMDDGNGACGCGDANLGFTAEGWSQMTPWAPGFGTAPPIYPQETPKCTAVQCVDWCASNNHPHFDLDQGTYNFLCPGTEGSCVLTAVTPVAVKGSVG